MLKKTLFIAIISLLFVGTTAYAAPYFRQEAGLVPITDSEYYLGTTTPATKAWKSVITDEVCLTGDVCRTAWPSLSGGWATTSEAFYWSQNRDWSVTTNIFSQSTLAPTTTRNIHISGTGTSTNVGGFESWRLISAPYFHATSTTATSTFSGAIKVPVGAEGSPSIVFGTEANTGLHLQATGVIDVNVPNQFRVDINGQSTLYDFQATQFLPTPNATNKLGAFGYAWNGLYASSTSYIDEYISTNGTTTNATSTNLSISGTLDVDSLTSALTLTGSTGIFAEYAGTSCTNQFVRSLDALGGATCATVSSGDVSLANLTATDSTLTFSGTYTGATARTIGLNLASANVWTASTTFTGGLTAVTGTTTSATSTNLQVSSKLTIPNGTAPTVAQTGDVAFDTTSGQFKVYDATRGQTNAYLATTSKSFNISSTTMPVAGLGTGFKNGTSTIWLHTWYEAITASGVYCTASSSGVALIRFGDQNGNYTNDILASTGATRTFTPLTTNNTWTQGEDLTAQASSTSGVVERINCAFYYKVTAD